MYGIAKVGSALQLGNGAQFWAYISPDNDTAKKLSGWAVQLSQADGNWSGSITSEEPQAQLQTPNLSGRFKVKVVASLNGDEPIELTLLPLSDSQPDIGCNSNCAAMIGIVADADGPGAKYWTVSDAMCTKPEL